MANPDAKGQPIKDGVPRSKGLFINITPENKAIAHQIKEGEGLSFSDFFIRCLRQSFPKYFKNK